MVQTFFRGPFLLLIYCFWRLDLMLLLRQTFFGRGRPSSVVQRASQEKCGPISEDSVLGHVFPGMDKVYGSLSIK